MKLNKLGQTIKNIADANNDLVWAAKNDKLNSSFFYNVYPDYEELKRIKEVLNSEKVYKYDSIINHLLMG